MSVGSRPGILVAEMNERITKADVEKVARLAMLRLDEAELERFTDQLDAILDHATDMQRLDLDGVEPMTRPIPLTNVMRRDEVGPLLDREEVLACAPAVEAGQYRVPPVLGDPS